VAAWLMVTRMLSADAPGLTSRAAQPDSNRGPLPAFTSRVPAAMGQKPTEEELFQMISEVDENMSGSIDFGEFLKVSGGQRGSSSR